MNDSPPNISEIMHQIYSAAEKLEELYPGRPFTPDGHMVGSIGECLVAEAYELKLMPPSNRGYDAISPDGKKVEIKATQAERVAFRSCPEHVIAIKINKDGSFEERYNGPGVLIWEQVEGRKLPSNGQYQITLLKLDVLNSRVSESDRIVRVQK